MMTGQIDAYFGEMPVYMGCVTSSTSEDVFWPMRWVLNEYGLLRVDNPPPLELVYLNQHNDPGVSELWMAHHRSFAKFILSIDAAVEVLEIGGADGTLARIVREESANDLDWSIIEPNPHLTANSGVRLYKGWFPADLPSTKRQWKKIAASHVFEHTVDPYRFLLECHQALCMNGHLVLSWPDMDSMAERGDLNMLNFEHLYYLPFATAIKMLDHAGFAIEKVENFRRHSFFVHARKRRQPKEGHPSFSGSEQDLEQLAHQYLARLTSVVDTFNSQILEWDGEVWLFGAHIFSQYLLAAGLDQSKLTGVLDNAKGKKDKRLYGTSLYVSIPDQIASNEKVLILVAAALYEREIADQLKALGLQKSRVIGSQCGIINLP